jgi:hypothetical protein
MPLQRYGITYIPLQRHQMPQCRGLLHRSAAL